MEKEEKDINKKNIKWGIIFSYATLIASVLGTLFITNRVLAYIGEYNYGLLSFVNSITTWMTVVSSALNSSFVKFSTSEADKNSGNTSKINTIYLKLLLGLSLLVLFVSAAIILPLYFCNIPIGDYSWEESRKLYLLFGLSIINIIITMPTTIYNLYVSFKQKFIFTKLLTLITTVLNFALHLLLAYFTQSIVAIAICTIGITILNWVLNAIYSKKSLGMSFQKTSIKENIPLVKSIFIFSGILILNAVVDQINMQIDKTILGFMDSPESVTTYQFGQSFTTYLMLVSVAICDVYTPLTHQLVVEEKEEELNQLFLDISKKQTIIICLIAFGFLSCGKDFVLWWLDGKMPDVYYLAAVLMCIDICPLTMNASIEIQRAKNKHKFRAFVYLGVAILNVCLSILFIKLEIFENMIYACLLGTVIARLLSHWILMNIYNNFSTKLPVGKYMLIVLLYCLVGLTGFGLVMLVKHTALIHLNSNVLKVLCEGSIFVVIYALFVAVINRNTIKTLLRRK